MWKFWSAAEPAIFLVKHFLRRFDDGIDHRHGNISVTFDKRLGVRNRALNRGSLLENVAIFFAISL